MEDLAILSSICSATNNSETPYRCIGCSKSFRRKLQLKEHYRVHSQYRPYKCTECMETYTYKSNLNRHVKKYHSPKNPLSKNEIIFVPYSSIPIFNASRQSKRLKSSICITNGPPVCAKKTQPPIIFDHITFPLKIPPRPLNNDTSHQLTGCTNVRPWIWP
jgi:uncharacterized Zn-finger protein